MTMSNVSIVFHRFALSKHDAWSSSWSTRNTKANRLEGGNEMGKLVRDKRQNEQRTHTHTPTKNRPSSHPLWHASMSVVINSKLQPISLLRSPWSTFVVPPHLSTSMLSQPTRQRMPLSTASPGGARPGLGESWQNGSNESDRTLFQFPLVPLPRPSEKPPLSKVLKPN